MFVARRPAPSRPKGLWKARSKRVTSDRNQSESSAATAASLPRSSPLPPSLSCLSWSRLSSSSSTSWVSVEEEEEFGHLSGESSTTSSSASLSTSSSYKRRRIALECSDGEDDSHEDPDQVYLWDYSCFILSSSKSTPPDMKEKKVSILMPSPGPSRRIIPRQRVYSAIGSPGEVQEGDEEFTWEDWEELQAAFLPFEEDFEPDITSVQHLPNLRAIIHESHRFLSLYPNPSSFFLLHSPSTPPTVVYTLLAHALFVFGLIMSIPSNTSEALDTEPKLPTTYWLAALDVFAIGDGLAAEDEGALPSIDLEVDWKMSLTWGMTMIRLSRELVEGRTVDSFPSPSSLSLPGSPLDYISQNRPPHTPSSNSLEVKDLLKYAMDQITRGIFHMPRQLTNSPLVANINANAPGSSFFSVFAIAVEVLRVSSQLTSPSDRVYWLRWADSLFSSATVSTFASMNISGPLSDVALLSLSSSSAGASVSVYRGRCELLLAHALIEVGAAVGEEVEWKEEVGDALQNAVKFLEEALGSDSQMYVGLKRKWGEGEEEEEEEVVRRAEEVERMMREAREMLERFT
ncbi:hypothetical protein E1B28_008034 [Marasmius oreades]|uniref:Uncharacterized protein n=1 Tax=Marasmius oreades TaxID=181124 RepID=A0A9P7S2V0_9AGAR|nr:uncharacterized protein E1B28_008034 [Marasmius oreades]KAG7094436.1 hypothetical protein E1B28_008034 [Marasmius oreades]